MDEDLGIDSGFDDMGSSDIDIDSGFDDASLDTDFSVDDIGTDDIVSDEFSEIDSSMDTGEAFESFGDTGSADLDLAPVEDIDSAETDVGLELPEESFDLNEETDPSVDEGDLALDDFDDIDSFDTEDTTSLTELDSEDLDSSDEAEDITDDTEDDFISETEEDGYFDSIPNEMEPYVMDEAQSETDADSAETFTEVEEESPEDFEIGFETDALEETDSPNDTESNDLPSAEIDNDTPDGDLTVEEADVPEDDKTPYEAMRDYMYEHNYSQMDYPEYSQDPEWQALNEQYTASLEETPATEEIAVDTVDQIWDNTDTNEPQELHDGDVIDIQGEGTDNVSEPSDVFEVAADVAPEVSDTLEEGSDDASIDAVDADMPDDDKTPYETMRDYMYEHNYSQTDYPEYSQDPEWQALNEQYTSSLEESPATDELASEDLERAAQETVDTDITDDTAIETEELFAAETSGTNEHQELYDGDVIDIQSENNEGISENPDVFEEAADIVSQVPDGTEEATDEASLDTSDADTSERDKTPYEAMRDYMYEHDYGQMDYPEYSQDPEWQALNEQYTASLEETPATDELAGEDLEQTEAEATDTVITEDMAVDTAEVIPETASESTGDMPELTETEDMFDVAWDEDITEAVETTETPDIEELHELTDDECNEIYEPWDGERLSESFDDIDIAADPERLDSTLNDFVESNWENLSLDEQKQSMQSLADCVVDTIGFKNPPAIEFYNNPSECDYGGYDSSTNTLSVNEYMLYDSNEAADTIAHELWHAHQHECAMDPQSTRDLQYQFNFDNYIPPEDGMEDYQAQLIEAEARAFAEQFKDRLAQLRGRI